MSFTERLTNLIYQCIDHSMARRMHPRIGIVSSYDPATHSVKLLRQPENIETGFIPLPSHAIGAGWGIVTGPQVGDQFVMGFIGGDVEVPFIAGRLFSDQEKPPTVQSGEILMKHQSGSSIAMRADGSVAHSSAQGLTIAAGQGVTLSSGAPMSFTGGGNLS
ncbi:hypothetical protein DYH55_00275 [Methylovirgula sp. 4M-Z18]|nr:hypothetical protein DYH55_00275 [Methylovirgula sp. 4M-Z18]